MQHPITKNPPIEEESIDLKAKRDQQMLTIGIIVVGVLLLAGLGFSIYFLLQDSQRTALVRDTMVVLLALEMFFIGFTAVLLILQITRLVNLLQNEIKPHLLSVIPLFSRSSSSTVIWPVQKRCWIY
jgi:hypothetical protein